jgi:hypothetical protein
MGAASRCWEPTVQRAQFIRFGTPEQRVDEVVVYGSQLIGMAGTGTIRKVILVDMADTHVQDGSSWGLGLNVAESALKSITLGVKGGDSSNVRGGKAYFHVPGVTILEPIERITPKEYDRRYGLTVTKHMTPAGQTAGAWDAAYSGRLELGEDSVGFEVPNALIPGQATHTTSQRLTHQDIQKYLNELGKRKVSKDEALNEMGKHIRDLEESGAHEEVLEQWQEQYESMVDQLTTDPTDITRDDPWTQYDEEPSVASAAAAAAPATAQPAAAAKFTLPEVVNSDVTV